MTTYASLSDLKHYVGIEDVNSDSQLLRVLEAASQWIDQHTGRVFTLDAADTTRVFYPNNDSTVSVPDLVSVTSIKTDSQGNHGFNTTLAVNTDYELRPLDGPPYQTVTIWPTSSKSFAPGRLVQIVGKFGYTVSGFAPAAVQQACLILAARFYRRSDAPFGILQTVDLGQFTRISKEDPDVISLLAPYMVTGSSWVAV